MPFYFLKWSKFRIYFKKFSAFIDFHPRTMYNVNEIYKLTGIHFFSRKQIIVGKSKNDTSLSFGTQMLSALKQTLFIDGKIDFPLVNRKFVGTCT